MTRLITWIAAAAVLAGCGLAAAPEKSDAAVLVGIGEQGAVSHDRITTDLTSISGMARRLKLSRTQLSRKIATAEAMGSLGWTGTRGKSPVWVSTGFRHEYHKAQAVKLAIIDAAFDACFGRDQRRDAAQR